MKAKDIQFKYTAQVEVWNRSMFLRQWLSGSWTRPAPGPRPAPLVFLRRVDPRRPELRPDLTQRDALALVRHVDVGGELAADLGAQDGAAGGRLWNSGINNILDWDGSKSIK